MVASAIVTALAVSLAVIGPSARSAEAMMQPFVGVSPQRVLETRSGPNDTTVDGQQQGVGVLAADQTRDVPVLGRGTIPATGVAAVALNVTAISPSATSFLTLFPTGSTRPNASNLNLAAGRTLPNMVIVPVGTNGSISVYSSAGTTHLAVDVLGWFPTGSAYQGLSPERLLDTRPSGVTVDGLQQATTAFNPGETRVLSIGGRGSVPAAGVGAVVLNVTAVGPSADAFITAFPTGASRPNASNLNTAAGRTLPNMAIVPVGDGGSISLFNSAGTTHLIVDVLGWFPVGTAFAGLTPARLLDTRPSGLTIDGLQQNTGVFTAETRTLVIAGRGGLPATDMGAVALNITAISPTTNAFITVFPAGSQRPTASNLNLAAGRTVPNMVIVPVGAGGAISIFNSAGTTHLAVDVLGWFPSPSAAGTSLVSELLDNAPRGGSTAESIISRDGGFVAFASLAANHVYGDTNGKVDVFVANTETGAVELASLSNTDQPLNGTSDEPAISDDGRFVVFTTDAAAVPSDTNGIDDVYVRDRQAGTTTLVSLRADGSQFVSASGGQVSGNGNVVAFVAVQIGAFDALVESIFVRDVAAGTTVLASPSAANFNIGSAGSTSISQDGDKVAVVKRRSSGSASHIFRFDRSSGTFTQFTPSASNVSDPQGGTRPVLADDGAAVVYERAGDLFQFVANGTEQRVDVSTANVAANGASANARFAGSSHDVIFDSQGSNLVTGDANGVGDVFLRTTGTTKTTTLLSVRVKAGITTFANNASLTPSMSADRSKLVFRSLASNLAPQATAGRVNLLLNQGRGVTYQQVDLSNGTTVAHGASERPALTPDGRYVVFASTAADLVIGDGNNATDVFRLDRVTHQVVKASVSNSAGELRRPSMALRCGKRPNRAIIR